jgi:hypothetical protein
MEESYCITITCVNKRDVLKSGEQKSCFDIIQCFKFRDS